MKPPGLFYSFLAAVGVHALILFGCGIGSDAKPLPLTGEPATVDVTLEEAAPGAEAVAEPTPEPQPEPTPPPPVPEATPEPTPPPPPEPDPAPVTDAAPTPQPTPPPRPAAPKPEATPALAKPRRQPGPAAPADAHAAQTDNHGSGGSALPRARSNPKPDYPREALEAKHEGVVLISVEVSAEGRPTAVNLIRSSGFPELDESTLRTLWRWRFEPARVAGFAVATRINVPIRFRIDGR